MDLLDPMYFRFTRFVVRIPSKDNLSEAHHMKDRISELPDDILSHILMPLSLRDVVRLATLSKRWRKIWLVLPHLDLDPRVLRGGNPIGPCLALDQYLNTFDYILQCHKNSNILSFGITCCLPLAYASHLHSWLNFAATRKGLKNLKLLFHNHLERSFVGHTISGSFFSEGLEKLDLEGCALKCQSDFKFNKLKSVTLCDVSLEGIEWGSLVCCPTIESLRLNACNLPDKLCFGYNLTLLSICRCPTLRKIELSASNLKTFEFQGVVDVECCFLPSTKLENLFVYMVEKVHQNMLDNGNMLRELVNNVSRLKNLILRVQIHNLKLPTLPSDLFLSVLWLHLDMYYDFNVQNDVPEALPHLLRCFPMLRKLDLTCPRYPWPTCDSAGVKRKPPTPYLHTRLMEVGLYNCNITWTEFASFLLRSAIVLDRMVITRCYKYYMGFLETQYHALWFHNEDRVYMQRALHRKALSHQANVIIL